jgi:hypothetical protein
MLLGRQRESRRSEPGGPCWALDEPPPLGPQPFRIPIGLGALQRPQVNGSDVGGETQREPQRPTRSHRLIGTSATGALKWLRSSGRGW